MKIMENVKLGLGVLALSLFTVPTKADAFNSSKLTMMCDFFSENKELCYEESALLITKNKDNSVISQCFNKYESVKEFNNCVKYEYNPLIFLKHQKNKKISGRKILLFKDQIINSCSNKSTTEARHKCIKDEYFLLQKGKMPKNWLENSCLYRSKDIKTYKECVTDLKREALSQNHMASSIPNLINALNSWEGKLDNRISLYFKQVYSVCEERFSDMNAFDCMDGQFNRNIENIIDFDFTNSTCFKYESYNKFSSCLETKIKK